jgi:hypothetical protein
MSEYQYYEFQASERPLTESQMRELPSYSTRARITSTRFVNEYQWGDFKGDPRAWIEKYFDAFLYLANWGARDFMFRLPRHVLAYEIAQRYCCGDSALARGKGEWIILEFHSEDDQDDDWVEGNAQLSVLIPLRAELARGDHRSLYLAWLLCVQAGDVDGDAEEPPVPDGLRELSGPLQAFAEFLRVDGDLIAAAAEGSAQQEASIPRGEIERWIQSLSEAEKTRILLDVALDGPSPQAELLKAFRTSRSPQKERTGKARTVAQLLAQAGKRATERCHREAEQAKRELARREQEVQTARERYLNDLAKRQAEAWSKVDQLIATRQPKKYDEAVALLSDLRELALRDGEARAVVARLWRIQTQHEQN